MCVIASPAGAIVISSHSADGIVQEDGTVVDSAAGHRIGIAGDAPRHLDNGIFFFEIPSVPAFAGASVSFDYFAKLDGPFPPVPFDLDLYGLGYVTGTPAINPDWHWDQAVDDTRTGDDLGTNIGAASVTKIQDSIVTKNTTFQIVETQGAGDTAATAFLNSLLSAGASPGDYAVFRLNTNFPPFNDPNVFDTRAGYSVHFAEFSGASPKLSVNTPEPIAGLLSVLVLAATLARSPR